MESFIVVEPITSQNIAHLTPSRLFGTYPNFLTAVTYDPTGQLLAAGDVEGNVKVWHISDDTLWGEYSIRPDSVVGLVFGQDPTTTQPTLFVIGRNEKLTVLRLEANQQFVPVFEQTQAAFNVLAGTLTREGRPVIAATAKNLPEDRLFLLYADDKSSIKTFAIHANAQTVAFSADGETMALGDAEGGIQLHPTQESYTAVQHIQSGLNGIRKLAFNGLGNRIAALAGMSDHIRVYDIASGEALSPIIPTTFPREVSLNTDGSLLMVSSNQKGGSVRLYDVPSGRLVRSLKGSHPTAFSPFGDMLVCGDDYAQFSKALRLWNLLPPTGGLLDKIGGRIDPASAEGYRIEQFCVLEVGRAPVNAVAFSPDNMMMAASSADRICLWNSATLEQTLLLTEHRAEVTNLAFSPDGALLASSSGYFNNQDDNSVRLWNPTDGGEVLKFTRHGARVVGAVFHPSGEWLISADTSGIIYVWQVKDGALLQTIKTPSPINDFALSPDGAVVVTAHGSEMAVRDMVIRFYNTQSGELIREVKALKDWVLSVAFSPDGRQVAAADYANRVTLWRIEEDAPVLEMVAGDFVRYTPEGSVLMIAQDKTVKLTIIEGVKPSVRLRQGTFVSTLGFSRVGELLAVGLKDGSVVVWGVPEAKTAIPEDMEKQERERLAIARSGRHTLQLLGLRCINAQENDGDEIMLKVDGQTIWRADSQLNRKMHHKPSKQIEVSEFDFVRSRALGMNGWRDEPKMRPDDFRFSGLTGPIELELWEEDFFLRGGNDLLGKVTISPAQAGQGKIEIVIQDQHASYALTFEVLFT